MDIKQREESLKSEFSGFKNWEQRYKHIIKLGRELEALSEEEKIEDLKVKGCQSQVWLKAELTPEGLIHFRADSDALIVKGLIAILLRLYSDARPQEIMEAQADVLEELGLKDHLSPSRANGLYSMFKQIKFYGLAYQHIQQR